jgi:hypothetical protein
MRNTGDLSQIFATLGDPKRRALLGMVGNGFASSVRESMAGLGVYLRPKVSPV